MPDTFDPYHKWLGIRREHQPPNHYRLLGIEPFEDDPDVIVNAAQQRMAHVRTYQLGQHSALSQRILNEIAAAKACLRDSDKKAEYDQQLRCTLDAAATPPPADDSARLDLALVGAVVAGTTILLLLFVLVVRTPDGTLIVEINEPDAVVQVLDADGRVEMTRRSQGGPLAISVDPGQHRLGVEKDGFVFFTENFTMESGGTTRIRARLEPLPPELRPLQVLQRMVGTWQEEGVTKTAEARPAGTRVTYTTEISAILGGHFVLQRASDKDGKVAIVTIRTFDPEQKEYRQWLFDSNGSASELSGQWNDATNTLTLTDEGQSITPVLTIHFPNDETMEWRLVSRDRQGKVYLDVEGKSTRQK